MPKEDIEGRVRHWRMTPTDEYLANPHKGCCTFQRFNGDPLYPSNAWSEEGPLYGALDPTIKQTGIPGLRFSSVTEGYLPCTVAYCRWFWRNLEPARGQYDFTMIDRALDACHERGQTLAVRLMPFGFVPTGQPRLPEWYERRFPMLPYADWDVNVPDYESNEYVELWGDLIREFGKRYDANPLIESFDISFLGPWGEGGGKCRQAVIERVVDGYVRSFPNTPLLAMIGHLDGGGDQMLAGVSRGSGWRADCFGDLKRTQAHPSPMHMKWNHMFNCYPARVCETGAQEVWKTAPVHFEVGGVPMDWCRDGYDLTFILEQGLKYHATYFMPKSCRLPEVWMGQLAAFCRKLGYRFVLRQATLSTRVRPRGEFVFRVWIENIGIAPLYRRYDFALRLTQGDNQKVIVFDDVDPRRWVPGDVWIDRKLRMPDLFEPGWIEVCAGLLDPNSHEPKVSFAVKERYLDRWTMLGGIEVRS